MAKDLTKTLTSMPDADELKTEIDAELSPEEEGPSEGDPSKEAVAAQAPVDPREELRRKEVYTFPFDWQPKLQSGEPNPKSKRWKGQFTNKVLGIKERQAVGILRAKLSGGLPFDSLDPLTNEINLMVAHLTYSLTEKPEWLKLSDMKDYRVLQEIFGEVALHEATFLG